MNSTTPAAGIAAVRGRIGVARPGFAEEFRGERAAARITRLLDAIANGRQDGAR